MIEAGYRLITRSSFHIGDGNYNQNLVFNTNCIQYYDETDANKTWGIGVDDKDYSFHIVHDANKDVGGDSYIESSKWNQDIVFPRKSGTVALAEDVDDVIKIFDFTSLDFTNVIDNLSNKGRASVNIEDEILKNNLKTIFDRLQNNKTSFIEFPQLQTGAGTAETIQKTRMFALIQNSIYLGTGIYGLYGLMYFYGKNGNQDVLTEIRINTNLDTYNSIEFIDVKRDLVEKSTNKKIVYTNNDNGIPSTLGYSVSPNNSAIAQFNSNGQLYSNAPTADIHVANKKYVDGRMDYILLTQSAFIYNYPLEESDRLLLIDFYNKHYQKDKIPLFVVDRNGFTTTLRIAGTNIIHIFIWSDSQAPIVFFIDLTQTNIKFNRIIGGHLHSILGQSSWSGDVNARI